MRGGAAAPLAGESQRSGAYLLQQFMQSATNDFAWQAAKEAVKGSAFDLGASLDRWRDGRQAQQMHSALAAQGDLPRFASALQRAMPDLPQQGPLRDALQQLEQLQALGPDDGVQGEVLRRAADALRPSAAENGLVGLVLERVEGVLASVQRHDEMARWRAPAGADRAR
jgi:hypothetical protein